MTQPAGFGKSKTTPKKVPSAGAKQRAAAAKEYDDLKGSGLPEYEIFIRLAEQKQWMAVGAIAVRRSTQIHAAIYANEDALLKGAYHRMPVLKKNRANLVLEYGYRLKEFKDDPIELAVRPAENVTGKIQAVIGNVGDAIAKLFQPKAAKE
jgi:hypothetical protein